MARILDVLRDNVTLSRIPLGFGAAVLLMILAACSTAPSGGGGAAVLCALDGTCPVGMTCTGQVCAYNNQGTVGSDAGAAAQDSGAQDAGATNSAGIAALQAATASKICAKLDGELSVAKDLTLSGVVATADAAPLGKIMVFYVRPANASNTDGRWQGLKIVVFKGKSTVKAGDILTLTGELVEYYCESELKVDFDKIQVIGKANLAPTPYDVVIAEVSAKGLQSEAYEGVYVRLSNLEVVEPNFLGTDGKPHGQFVVAAAGGSIPIVVIGGTSGTSFGAKDPKTGNAITTLKKGQLFKTITGHLTYSFETYVLRPSSDTDLVAQ